MRMVDAKEWNLSGMPDQARRNRLIDDAPDQDQLVLAVAREAMEAALRGDGLCEWQPGTEMVGCHRAVVVFPLRTTFDALFNGEADIGRSITCRAQRAHTSIVCLSSPSWSQRGLYMNRLAWQSRGIVPF